MNLTRHPTLPNVLVDLDTGDIYERLIQSPAADGYRTVKVRNHGTQRAHRLICAAAHGPPPFPRADVRHLDGDPTNDHPSNLAWGSRAENCADAKSHGRTTAGERNAQARLSAADVREIKRRRANGETGRRLAEEFGVSERTVCDIHRGRTWVHLTLREVDQ